VAGFRVFAPLSPEWRSPVPVIPAKAGIQGCDWIPGLRTTQPGMAVPRSRHSREGGNPGLWLDSGSSLRSARNDAPPYRSFPRRRESRVVAGFRGLRITQPGMTPPVPVIPAKAGIHGYDPDFESSLRSARNNEEVGLQSLPRGLNP